MKIAVTTNSFSKNSILVDKLKEITTDITLNKEKRYTKEELINVLKDADAAIVGLDEINDSVLRECKNLKIVAKYGVGLNNIDQEACRKRGIEIGWSGGINRLSVAEMTLGYMLMLIRNLYVSSNKLKNGIWEKNGGFELSNKKIGIIGVGYIGKEVIRLLKPFNSTIFVNDIIEQKEFYSQNSLIEATKKEIFRTCDIITIHTPLDENTKNMINEDILYSMKDSAFIINSARGGIINENDLKYALQNNIISGAAIDAYVQEPPADKDLIKLENLICTPHIGGNSKEGVEAMGISAIEHIKRFLLKEV